MQTKGTYIVLEGPEGTGKGTQVALLKDALEKAGKKVLVVREPGGTPIGEKLRTLLKDATLDRTTETEILLFSAARAELASQVIEPALLRGEWVISDRSYLSTVAYQICGHDRPDLQKMVEDVTSYALKKVFPLLTIILDVEPEVGLARAKERNAGTTDRFDDMEKTFHARVRQGYLLAAKKENFPVVEAGKSVEEVAADIWQLVSKIG